MTDKKEDMFVKYNDEFADKKGRAPRTPNVFCRERSPRETGGTFGTYI
jgi:hypothetical protein